MTFSTSDSGLMQHSMDYTPSLSDIVKGSFRISRTMCAMVGAGLLLTIFTGCGAGSDAPDTYEFAGTVTYNGAPLTGVTVNFQPTSGRPSIGTVDKEGKFTMRYTMNIMGVPAGENKIYIEPLYDDPEQSTPSGDLKKIVSKYGRDTSEYLITVDKPVTDYALKLE